ncbi:precorrin-3B synthase [Actinophytocola sp. KF-1]
MARIRVPGGQLSSAAFRVIAEGAAELGDGTVELTSRANLQVRGLADGAETELAARLFAAGLLPSATHDKVRNILASPLTGRDRRGLADVRPFVSELDAALRANARLAALPGRFLFALDDGRGDVAWLGADVAALATTPDTAAILLGGTDSGLRVPLADVILLMLACAEAFLTERADEWRLAELDERARRRVAARLGASVAEPVPPQPVQPGPLGQVTGTALVAGAPLGWLDRVQAAALADTGAPLVVTPWRAIVVADLADTAAVSDDRYASSANVAQRLRSAGLLLDPDTPRVTACVGRPGCAKALSDVRADARPVPGADVPVHWSGCARRCGRPRGEVVDVVANGAGYVTTRGDR